MCKLKKFKLYFVMLAIISMTFYVGCSKDEDPVGPGNGNPNAAIYGSGSLVFETNRSELNFTADGVFDPVFTTQAAGGYIIDTVINNVTYYEGLFAGLRLTGGTVDNPSFKVAFINLMDVNPIAAKTYSLPDGTSELGFSAIFVLANSADTSGQLYYAESGNFVVQSITESNIKGKYTGMMANLENPQDNFTVTNFSIDINYVKKVFDTDFGFEF